MYDWETLIDQAALEALLPTEHAYLARPVRDGLCLFLKGLPPPRQAEIIARQATLPCGATVSERLGLLARSCPVLQKLGQILARDQRLAPELQRQLRQLESLPPSVPLAQLQDILCRELGPLDRRGVTLRPPAIAEASVAVVVPFEQNGGTSDERCQGVFKILKPDIEQRLDEELTLLGQVGSYLDQRCDELRIPHLDYQESFAQVRDKLVDEIRLDQEQVHLAQARQFHAADRRVLIPRLLDHCTPRVTAMERVRGVKVTDHRLQGERRGRRLSRLVVKALVARPVFSKAGAAMFHGDPHAGNLMWTEDERLAILDWSLVGRLQVRQREAIVQLVLGAVTLDRRLVGQVLLDLADGPRVDRQALDDVVWDAMRRVRRGQLPGVGWLIGMLDDAVQKARLRVDPDLMLFRKSWHSLEGVVAATGTHRFLADEVLGIEFLRHFIREWPQRWFSWPGHRDFATRLSNLDLTRALCSAPMAASRFWTDETLDLLS